MSDQDTIYALSSGVLPSGVAVIRISGARTRFVLETICGQIPLPRTAVLKTIRDRNNLVIDRGLVLFFPGPRSFTGEDSAELHLHGGRAVVKACYNTLASFDECRLAEAGEFTKRAFDNGKLDLTESEGLADLLSAETEMQRRLAVDQSGGALKVLYNSWSDRILRSRALIEAELDFSDEEDIPGSVSDQVWSDVSKIIGEIKAHLEAAKAGEITRSGFVIAIAGAPNAGKSSLLNKLSGRDVAIVSEEEGTTRDILEVRMDIDGHLVIMKDTAGIRETANIVEKEGIRRAQQALVEADLNLFLIEPDESDSVLSISEDIDANKLVLVGTKSDISTVYPHENLDLLISTQTGEGLDALLDAIKQKLEDSVGYDHLVVPTRDRHVSYLNIAVSELQEAFDRVELPIELRSEHLRTAQTNISRITGRVDVEDLLGVIFSEFCVGK